MLQQQIFLPESMYNIDSSMTFKKLFCFYNEGTTITGKVRRINSTSKIIEVELGNDFLGFMSFKEATIYPIYRPDGRLSPNVYRLMGKNIRVKIIGFDPSNQFPFLSRKEHMLDALTFLKSKNGFINAYISSFSKHSAFFDLGGGIIGRSNTKNFSSAMFRDIRDIGLRKGDIIPVQFISFSEEENRFDVSRIAGLPSVFDSISAGDVVTAQVFEEVNDVEKIGYYILVDKMYSGIVDSPDIPLEYGDTVCVFIKKIKENGKLKTSLVKKW